MHTNADAADGVLTDRERFEAASVLNAGFRLAQRTFEERGVITGP